MDGVRQNEPSPETITEIRNLVNFLSTAKWKDYPGYKGYFMCDDPQVEKALEPLAKKLVCRRTPQPHSLANYICNREYRVVQYIKTRGRIHMPLRNRLVALPQYFLSK